MPVNPKGANFLKWIHLETQGNPDPKYQKSERPLTFGLWSATYSHLLGMRKHGGQKPSHYMDGFNGQSAVRVLGDGALRVFTLSDYDYGGDLGLVATFLPCMKVDKFDGKIKAPGAQESGYNGRVLFPYNYDDNNKDANTLGTTVDAYSGSIIDNELFCYPSASRSRMTWIPGDGVAATTVKNLQTWAFNRKPGKADLVSADKAAAPAPQATQSPWRKRDRFYSVKSGVRYVGTNDQTAYFKDKLESSSAQAMFRSNVISQVERNYQQALEARYQIEVLTVLVWRDDIISPKTEDLDPGWDGYQIRQLNYDDPDEIWFPSLAIPSEGKKFAAAFPGFQGDWVDFWTKYFAIPLGRAKAEMLVYFGMMHSSANAQNFMSAFNVGKHKFNGIILRDIGDTLLNDHFYNTLRTINPQIYASAWASENASPEKMILSVPMGDAYQDPVVTRTGGSSVFFFPPFAKGDAADVRVRARWFLAHNQAVLDYVIQQLGYKPGWDEQDDEETLTEEEMLRISVWAAGYQSVNPLSASKGKLLGASSRERTKLRAGLEQKITGLLAQDKPSEKVLKSYLDAHELLIGAEIQCFVCATKGKSALRALHAKRGTV